MDAYQAGNHAIQTPDAIKELRVPAKNGNYSFLNMWARSGCARSRRPRLSQSTCPLTIDVCGGDRDPQVVARALARRLRDGLRLPEKRVRAADRQSHCFDFTDGEYGAVVRRWQAAPVPAEREHTAIQRPRAQTMADTASGARKPSPASCR